MNDSLIQTALDLLDRAAAQPPLELKAEVDEVERAVAALRNDLIKDMRQAPTPDPRLRTALNQVNVALSLIVGVEYPVSGLQRDLIDQARTVLQHIARPLSSEAV